MDENVTSNMCSENCPNLAAGRRQRQRLITNAPKLIETQDFFDGIIDVPPKGQVGVLATQNTWGYVCNMADKLPEQESLDAINQPAQPTSVNRRQKLYPMEITGGVQDAPEGVNDAISGNDEYVQANKPQNE